MARHEGATPIQDLTFLELGEGYVPLEFVISVKCLSPEGIVCYKEIFSKGLHAVEALGMLTTLTDTVRNRLMTNTRPTRE